MYVLGFFVTAKDISQAVLECLKVTGASDPTALILQDLAEHDPETLWGVLRRAEEGSDLAYLYNRALVTLLRARLDNLPQEIVVHYI